MRKLYVFMSILFCMGCAGQSIGSNETLTLNQVIKFKVDSTLKSDIRKKIGMPDIKDSEDQEETWTYLDKETKDQRLVFTFAKNSEQLKSILWVPVVTEPENNLNYILSHFPNLKPEQVAVDKVNPHSPMDYITYRDEATGQVVMVSEARSKIVAVAWYSKQYRAVSNTSELKKIKYHLSR